MIPHSPDGGAATEAMALPPLEDRAGHEPSPAVSAVPVTIPSAVELSPTHYCVICAARWVNHADGTWSLATKDCGPCCDNVPMDAAPIIKFNPDGSLCGRDHDQVKGAYNRAQWHAQIERYGGLLCAICDEPFELHHDNWACPRRVAPRFKFAAQAIEARRAATLGAVHESAVGSADAPSTQRTPHDT